MEMIVVFNAGRDARRLGGPREAPETIEYPIVSRYVAYHTETLRLSEHAKREWLAGYDFVPKPVRAPAAPRKATAA